MKTITFTTIEERDNTWLCPTYLLKTMRRIGLTMHCLKHNIRHCSLHHWGVTSWIRLSNWLWAYWTPIVVHMQYEQLILHLILNITSEWSQTRDRFSAVWQKRITSTQVSTQCN